ncbi:MFS transporter [Kribbella sp. HUAS MG21]|uniref:MFS transporter n=1 Tax=Kribbella sp. HUAS MG21 TaxID=3160966 RepID=A0AAU7T7M6_9ACTN
MERSPALDKVLLTVCAADLLVTLDGTVVTVALPAIQRDLQVAAPQLQWVVTAYTLTLGAFLLVGGRAADFFGRRRVLVWGLTVFTLASAGAGLARDVAVLLPLRALQGLGAAFAVPAALAILSAVYRRERDRQAALGYLSATMDVSMVAGLVLGGVLTATLGWPWCFFVIVPVGLLAAALAPAALPESRDDHAARLDVRGAVLAAVGFAALSLGIVQLQHRDLTAVPLLVAACGVLILFVRVERRTRDPLVRLDVFRHRPLSGANLAISANAGGFGGLMFLSTLNLQQVLGYDALHTGLLYVPLAVSACAGGVITPHLIGRTGVRRTAVISMSVTAATFLLLAWRSEELVVLLVAFLVSGFTFAAAFVPLTSQGLTGVSDGEKGLASGLLQTSTHLGGALVLTVLATAAAFRTSAVSSRSTESAMTSGFSLAFLVGAVLLLLGAATAFRTLPRDVSG